MLLFFLLLESNHLRMFFFRWFSILSALFCALLHLKLVRNNYYASKDFDLFCIKYNFCLVLMEFYRVSVFFETTSARKKTWSANKNEFLANGRMIILASSLYFYGQCTLASYWMPSQSLRCNKVFLSIPINEHIIYFSSSNSSSSD